MGPAGLTCHDRPMTSSRFPILFTGGMQAMGAIGIRPHNSYVEVDPERVQVRMGWSFRATLPRSSVRSVEPDHDRVAAWGVHGWRGRWLVNGSSENVVRVSFDPPGRGFVLGFPVRLAQLRVSVIDPGGLIEALAPR